MKNRICVGSLACLAMAGIPQALAQSREGPEAQAPKMLERPQSQHVQQPVLTPGSNLTAYEMAWQARPADAIVKRLAGTLGSFLGADAARLILPAALRPVADAAAKGDWVAIAQTPLLAKYQPEYDELRVIHQELETRQAPAQDIGETGIRKAAEGFVKQLGAAGVIDPQLYAQAVMQLGYMRAGNAAAGTAVQPGRIVQYRVTLRPTLQGIEIANAGLRLGILPSGELASLRVGGVTPAGEWAQGVLRPSIPDSSRQIRISTKDLMTRFHQSIPNSAEVQVAWSRVMYMMPEGPAKAVVEPMLVISYTEQRVLNNERLSSRRKTRAYSLTDPNANPVDLDAPPKVHEGISPTRK